MTRAVLDTTPEVGPAPTGSRLPRLAAALPWLIPAGVLVAQSLATGTPLGDILRYAVYFALAVLLPGTLVHRALRGSSTARAK